MRGTVAKRLRRAAFKLAAKNPTKTKIKWYKKIFRSKDEDGKTIEKKVRRGTQYLTGYRAIYQKLKKEYKIGNLHLTWRDR